MMRVGILKSNARGFTLIELMVVVALVAIILSLVAPSFQKMIEMQRLRGTNAQIVTDLQYARGEAVRLGLYGRVVFGSKPGQYTCYTVYATTNDVNVRCNCAPAVEATPVCPPQAIELKTVKVYADTGVSVSVTVPPASDPIGNAFAFDSLTGGLTAIRTDQGPTPMASADIEARLDNDRRLLTKLVQTGRPQVCAPNSSVMQVNACAP